MNSLEKNTLLIKQLSARLGFDHCGIARAEKLEEDARRLENWLKLGMQGNMHYMERHFDLRVDPSRLVPGARSVITLLKNYYPNKKQNEEAPSISKYAFGKDYHDVIRGKLIELIGLIRDEVGEINGRGFVDSAPVLERSWAERSGLGWVGKNGNLINKQGGSFFFIATLITDLALQYDDPFARDYCGTCSKCLDACPTGAILPGKIVDGSRCISYFTIELKDELLPADLKGKLDNWAFGCDICQDICPWNRFAIPHHEKEFTPLPEILNLTTKEWEAMTEENFKRFFSGSALRRTKFKGMQRNIRFIQQ